MATQNESAPDHTRVLNELLHLEHDALAAYDTALERLEDGPWKDKIREFRTDHEHHALELARLIEVAGGTAVKGTDARAVLTRGKVVMAKVRGARGILEAVRSNEDQSQARYQKAVKPGLPEEVKVFLQKSLDDECRHRDWIAAELEGS